MQASDVSVCNSAVCTRKFMLGCASLATAALPALSSCTPVTSFCPPHVCREAIAELMVKGVPRPEDAVAALEYCQWAKEAALAFALKVRGQGWMLKWLGFSHFSG